MAVSLGQQENEIQTAIIEFLLLHNIFCWRNNNAAIYDNIRHQYRKPPKYHLAGVPDIIGILPDGRFLGVEVKTKDGHVSGHQIAFQEEATSRGAISIIARSVEDCYTIL